MFHFSRAIYRELARDIQTPTGCKTSGHEAVLKACEAKHFKRIRQTSTPRNRSLIE